VAHYAEYEAATREFDMVNIVLHAFM
jgi:hypothetical protein